ncbi:MAG: hypothetical protein AABW73_04935 [Nanoarchaeota archaeon]
MKTGGKGILALILVLSLTSIFLTSLVSAQSTAQKIWDPIKDMFTGWQSGNLSVGVAKWLFLFLLVVMIYEIVKFVPVIKNMHRVVKFIFSLIVGFLATAYLVPEEIKVALVSYGAFGLLLGGIIPFILLVFFSVEMRKEENGVGGLIVSYVIWIGYIGFLAWRTWDTMKNAPEGQEWMYYIYLIIIAVSLIFIFFQRKIMRALFRAEINQATESERKDLASSLLGEAERRDRDRPRGLTGAALATYDEKTKALRDRANKILGVSS